MTSKLKKAFEASARLAVDGLWDASFARRPAALEQPADEALREHGAGRTRSLEPDAL